MGGRRCVSGGVCGGGRRCVSGGGEVCEWWCVSEGVSGGG